MKKILKAAAVVCCLMTAAVSLPASAAEEAAPMTFRITAERQYLWENELEQADAVLNADLRIEYYSGITEMTFQLISDAPLHIENGDFTRDDTRQEYVGTDPDTKEKIYRDKPCFFQDYAEGRYTQHSEETGEENAVLWCSAGWMSGKPGEIYKPESSFVCFDLRIPCGTKAGVYRCSLSKAVHEVAEGLYQRDFYVYNGADDVTDSVAVEDCTVIIEPNPLYGDVNCDGEISVEDAQSALGYYTAHLAGKTLTDAKLADMLGTPYIHSALEAADPSRNGDITVEDAQGILQYYTALLAQKTPKWSDFF